MNNDIEDILHHLRLAEELQPSLHFKANARIRMLNRIANVKHTRMQPRPFFFFRRLALATSVLFLLVFIFSQESSPSDILFPVKVLSEKIALTLSPSKDTKTAVANIIVTRRIQELEKIKKQNNEKAMEQSITHLDNDIQDIQKNNNVSHTVIQKTISDHQELISEVRGKKNESSKQKNPPPTPATNSPMQAPPTPTERLSVQEPTATAHPSKEPSSKQSDSGKTNNEKRELHEDK